MVLWYHIWYHLLYMVRNRYGSGDYDGVNLLTKTRSESWWTQFEIDILVTLNILFCGMDPYLVPLDLLFCYLSKWTFCYLPTWTMAAKVDSGRSTAAFLENEDVLKYPGPPASTPQSNVGTAGSVLIVHKVSPWAAPPGVANFDAAQEVKKTDRAYYSLVYTSAHRRFPLCYTHDISPEKYLPVSLHQRWKPYL